MVVELQECWQVVLSLVSPVLDAHVTVPGEPWPPLYVAQLPVFSPAHAFHDVPVPAALMLHVVCEVAATVQNVLLVCQAAGG